MLDETGGHFHQAALEGLLLLRDAVPGGHGRLRGVSCASAGIQPFSLAR